MGKQPLQQQQNYKTFVDVIKDLEILRLGDHPELPGCALNIIIGSCRKTRKSKEEDNVTTAADGCDVVTTKGDG